jgi:hypothetical protein
MTQAIGRARRYGQDKHVHIYEFVTSKTIDVDILEKRKGVLLKVDSGFKPGVAPYPDFKHSTITPAPAPPGERGEYSSPVAKLMFAEEDELNN